MSAHEIKSNLRKLFGGYELKEIETSSVVEELCRLQDLKDTILSQLSAVEAAEKRLMDSVRSLPDS